MKKILILALTLLFCILSIALISCEDEEESSESKKESSSSTDDSSSDESSSSEQESSSSSSEDESTSSSSSEENSSSNTQVPNEPVAPHICEYGEWQTVTKATCTQKGLKRKACSCGDYVDEEIPATGIHEYEFGKCKHCKAEQPSQGLEFELDTETDTYIVTDIGSCTDTNIVIPSTYENKPVTSIEKGAFKYCFSLTSVTIPNSVTSIGSNAFEGCYKLVEVYNLSSLDVSSKFNYEKVIHTSLDEPSILETADDYIFMTWKNTYYLIGYVGNETELTLPDSYKGNNYEIYKYAFYGRNDITKVTIPDSVTSIGGYAFCSCDKLTNVTIGNGVTSIGSNAFEGCYKLASVTIGNSVTSIGSYAFYCCYSLTSITIPNSVTSIGSAAFYMCSSLTSITIPNGVTSIEMTTFYRCASLTSVTIGSSVTSIGSNAFYECHKLVEIYNLSSLNISAGTSNNGYIGYYAKAIHTSLDEPSILETTSDGYLFAYASDSNIYLVDYIGNATELTLPDGYRGKNYRINQYAFYERDDITKVTIPDSISLIGRLAFYNCDSLTSIVIPNSVTSIEDSAFRGCDSLGSVTFGNPNGWWRSLSPNATSGTSMSSNDLSIESTAASYLSSIYSSYYWKRG